MAFPGTFDSVNRQRSWAPWAWPAYLLDPEGKDPAHFAVFTACQALRTGAPLLVPLGDVEDLRVCLTWEEAACPGCGHSGGSWSLRLH